ncbi:MAG: carboxypeptidase regulatory-like domain-containing protein, partial [Lachnospiraceae bacterium]|nr:carboxypeptidase regulatory-like domain-containing protein [Lachnospiraceae bacterium]
MSSFGNLRVQINSVRNGRPIEGAKIRIYETGNPDRIVEEAVTNAQGQIETLELEAPPLEYSMEPSVNQPYSEYNILIEAEGFEGLEVNSAEILPGETAI